MVGSLLLPCFVTSLNSVVSLVVLLVVINSGASLSVWKDAKRKAAFWERSRGRREEEMKFDWQAARAWVTHPAPGILERRAYSGLWWHVCVCLYVVVCVYMCTFVFTWLNPIVEVTKFSLLAYTPRLAHVCVCVLEENESRLATKPQHRSQI